MTHLVPYGTSRQCGILDVPNGTLLDVFYGTSRNVPFVLKNPQKPETRWVDELGVGAQGLFRSILFPMCGQCQ